MNSINASFNECSAEIKRWLQREPEVKVEILTQWLLRELSKCSKNIHYKHFTFPDRELTTRADWQWWFVISNNLSFVAHACAIKPGDAGVQNTTMDYGNPAFYVLYNTNDQNTAKCKNGKSLDGIFLAEASKLREVFNENKNLSAPEILALSNPASCMVGCPGIYGEGMNKEEGFMWHVGNYYPMMLEDGEGRKSGFRETPKEIFAFIEGGDFSETLIDGNSDAILVFDLRG